MKGSRQPLAKQLVYGQEEKLNALETAASQL